MIEDSYKRDTFLHKNYSSIDIVKFLAALLVVAIHTRPFYSDAAVDYYFTCFCRVAVPFFFIATSFFFFRKENPDIKKYTKRLFTLYVIWFVIESPFVYQRFFVACDGSLSFQLLNFTRSLVFNNTWYASWYIMACIIGVNIIYWLSQKLNNGWLLAIGIIAYIVSLSCSSYSGAVDLLLNEKMRYYHAAVSCFFMPANSFIVALLYVVLGKIVAEKVQQNQLPCKQKNLVLLVVSGLLLSVEVYLIKWSVSISDAFVFLPIFVLYGFLILLQTNISIQPHLARWLRSMSILIYILHPVFSFVINPALFSMEYGGGYVLFNINGIVSHRKYNNYLIK